VARPYLGGRRRAATGANAFPVDLTRHFTPDRRFFDIVEVLFKRAIATRYRGSVLGVLWSAIQPLGMSIVYAAIFGHTFAPYYGGSLVEYGAAVYIGLSLIGFFVGGTTQALPSIVGNAGLLNKIRIPFAAFPLSILAAYGFQQAIGALPVIVLVSLFVNRQPLHVLVLLIPVLAIVLLSVGVGLFMSAACVYFRDVPYMYELVTFFLLVTSPVFYPVEIVPRTILHIIAWNPLFGIIESTRTIVLTPLLPSATVLGGSLAECAVAFVAGCLAFRAMRSRFMDLL
jgi:ABC-type polysaccharide/polyol phosphate export permease